MQAQPARPLVARVAALGVAVLGAACLKATAIDTSVYTEVACSANAPVTIVVGATLDDLAQRMAQGVVASTQSGCRSGSDGDVGDVVMLPEHEGESIAYAVMTRADGQPSDQCGTKAQAPGCIVAKRQVTFITHEQLGVRVDLRLSCLGVTCPTDQTCVQGQCVTAVVPPGCAEPCGEGSLTLPDGGAPDGSVGARDASTDATASAADSAAADSGSGDGGPTDAGSGGVVVLFGGTPSASGTTQPPMPLRDTWVWDGGGWAVRPVEGPPARTFASMAGRGDSVVLFGGNTSTDASAPAPLGDTWQWDGATWTEVVAGQGPSPRWGAGLATLNGKTVLFGGSDGLSVGGLNDTWQWDGTTWTQLAPNLSPSRRGTASMATLGSSVVLFGGAGDMFDDNDTWLWDGTVWTEATASGPSERASAPMTSVATSLLLFGGANLAGSTLGDTWLWSGTTWTLLATLPSTPTPRQAAAIATLGATAVLFGGLNASGSAQGDTWQWNAAGSGGWAEQTSAGPSARYGAAMSGP
jgi:hypothetical protein